MVVVYMLVMKPCVGKSQWILSVSEELAAISWGLSRSEFAPIVDEQLPERRTGFEASQKYEIFMLYGEPEIFSGGAATAKILTIVTFVISVNHFKYISLVFIYLQFSCSQGRKLYNLEV